MARILINYQERGINTVAEIIETWAPEHENPTNAYSLYVAERAGLEIGRAHV